MRRMPAEFSRFAAACAPVVVITVAALAVATLRRPPAGYRSASALLAALALGAGLGAISLLIVGLAVKRAARGAQHSLWRAATRWPAAAIVVAAFVIAAAAPGAVHGIAALIRNPAAARAAEQSAFRDWQAVVIPVTLSYTSALQRDAPFSHGLPRRHLGRLLGALRGSQTTLEELRRSLQANARRLRMPTDLARLTASLERALALGQRAQQTLTLAVSDALKHSTSAAAARLSASQLATLGVKQLRRSQAAMYYFSLDANSLGASLFVQSP